MLMLLYSEAGWSAHPYSIKFGFISLLPLMAKLLGDTLSTRDNYQYYATSIFGTVHSTLSCIDI